jgi:hypothetical protein
MVDRWRQELDTHEQLPGLNFVAAVPFESACSWISPSVSLEQRNQILLATIKDCFRVGPHFIVASLFELERNIIQLRSRTKELGFAHLYPDAYNGSVELRSEMLRLKGLMADLFNALPDEFSACEARGQVDRLFELCRTCPTWVGSIECLATFIWVFDTMVMMTSPSPEMEPDPAWFSCAEGLEAVSYSLRAARLLEGALLLEYDVNNSRLLTWIHTRVDRMTRVIFLHLRKAKEHGLPTADLLQIGIVACLKWFQGLGEGERFQEWISRLNDVATPESNEEEATDGGAFFARMVVSAQDKALAQYREEMSSLEGALKTLL